MFPIINFGPVAIQAVGFILLISFFIGTWLTAQFAKNLGTNGDAIENILLIGLLSGILSARIGFLLQNPSIITTNPLAIISLTPSMLDTSFGVLTAVIVMMILSQKKALPLWPTLDTLVPFLLLLFSGKHLADYASGTAFGVPTSLPWGVPLWNALRHPVQIYVLLMTAGYLIWLMSFTKRLKTLGFIRSGVLFLVTLSALGFITLFTRAFVSQKTMLGAFDVNQVFGLLMLILALVILYFHRFRERKYINVLILMGSNQDGQANFLKAQQIMGDSLKILRKSSQYKTEPVKDGSQDAPFLNQVLQVVTSMPLLDLRRLLKSIEQSLGRKPEDRKTIPIDLDILTYNGDVIITQDQHIPDPDLIKYLYIIKPVAEIIPDFQHPASGRSIAAILENAEDASQVIKLEEVENGTS